MTALARFAVLAVLCASPGTVQGQDGAAAATIRIRVVTSDFVLPAKLEKIAGLAREQGVALDWLYVETAAAPPPQWLEGADLVILDTPRPPDLAKVQSRLADALPATKARWVRVGGGPPAFGNLPPPQAMRLIGYYGHGGETNFRALFAYVKALREGRDTAAIPEPRPLPATGFYHPDAPEAFATVENYLAWGGARWERATGRVAFAIHSGLLSSMETDVVDAFVRRSEARNLVPMVFWFDAADADGVQKALVFSGADVIVNATHILNGAARAAEYLKLDVPVMQALPYREGNSQSWLAAASGVSQGLVASFMATSESWGVSDPIVTDVVERGRAVPMPAQVDALVAKAARLAALRHKAAADKHLALMFWNYPPGEKNMSASNLNLPRSLERLTEALAQAGYDVPPMAERDMITRGQQMMATVYDPAKLDALYRDGLAAALPLKRYRAFLDSLPEARRNELIAAWGDPAQHAAVRRIDGELQFLIPRLSLGKLTILPQMPRSGKPGAAYHDAKAVPDHLYLAAYLFLRETAQADALIHFGTHGTQEWTPGKDRGLAVSDYPFLAVGDLPVFYPYIQDNVAEALQARRRGRAVTISHQTPPFAPAGLYDELRDLHALVHEYVQLDEGAVRQATATRIRDRVIGANLHRDMGWDAARIEQDFPGFLDALHERLHALAGEAMPLGLHTFGTAAAPEHRLMTVMQQLGKEFYKALGSEPDEFFAVDFKALQASPPYALLHRHLRDGAPLSEIADAQLRAMVARGAALDRHLAETGEIEALLAGLAGRLVPPGPGGDPIRNPDVPSGRNLYGFEPDKLPTRAAYQAGEAALAQLVDAYRAEHDGKAPDKLAFSLWSSEAMRHLGVLEAQVLHALGLRPVWDQGGRVTALEVIPRQELGRPRIDAVLQVTGVYRDQFDGFMRMLAGAIEKIATLDEPDNAVARNSRAVAERLAALGHDPAQARRLAMLRIFGNAPSDYGTGLPDATLKSTEWESDAALADAFLDRMQYAYGASKWGSRIESGGNLLAEQLRGVQGAVLSRSSKLHGLLSTDHPFEYLGGLSLAVRRLDGASPSLYISDLREPAARVATAGQFLAAEMRARVLNPHWITGQKAEGYAGTLEILNAVNNLWGWQVADPASVRADQWQAVHDTFVNDIRALGLKDWFDRENPMAQAQMLERLLEAIRKGYWDAGDETRREISERWTELAAAGVQAGAEATRDFAAQMAAGFGLSSHAPAPAAPAQPPPASTGEQAQVRGQVMEMAEQSAAAPPDPWRTQLGLAALVLLLLGGAVWQVRANVTTVARF